MDLESFRAPAAGRVIRTPQGYDAFVPAPAGAALAYDADLVLALSRADAALGELSGLGRTVPNPQLLIAPYVRREAVLSSRIEGTRAGVADVMLGELEAVGQPSDDPDVREVRNYVTALNYGIERLASLPLSLRLVREIHAKLMEGMRGGYATPGEFRRSQNWIGPPGSTLATATYVPPPPQEMLEALGHWELFLHRRSTLPDLVQCALMHEHFEAIHPFVDGNGRVGRLLITLFLVERGRLTQPLLYLSAFFEAHRDRYYDLLLRIRTDGDWRSWIHFFLEGVTETSQQAVRQARDLMDLRESLMRRLSGQLRAMALIDHLFVNPYVTVTRAATLLRVSNPTARQVAAVLQDRGVLSETTGRSWGRIFVAQPILDVIEGRAAPPGELRPGPTPPEKR